VQFVFQDRHGLPGVTQVVKMMNKKEKAAVKNGTCVRVYRDRGRRAV
jgi:hypothetical protein